MASGCASGVAAPQLQDSAGSERPEAPRWLLDSIAETSKNASQTYLIYMSLLAYCALTLSTASDEQVSLNQSTVLPALNLSASFTVFLIVAPIIAVSMFVYLQFYQCRISGILSTIRNEYAPLGKPRLYPWLINFAEESEEGLVGACQRLVAQVSLWCLLPAVLALFALCALKAHSAVLSTTLAVAHVVGAVVVVYFWRRYQPSARLAPVALLVVVAVFETSVMALVWSLASTGYPTPGYTTTNDGRVMAKFKNMTRALSTVDLSYKDFTTGERKRLSRKHLEGANLAYSIFTGADLQEAHLQGANLNLAKLDKTNLISADLRGSNLMDAELTDAGLNGADLRAAILVNAKAKGARIARGNLREAVLIGTVLDGSLLGGADLRGADLRSADLTSADLTGADLEGANLTVARGLTPEQLRAACTLHDARLDDGLLAAVRRAVPQLLEAPNRDEAGRCLNEAIR